MLSNLRVLVGFKLRWLKDHPCYQGIALASLGPISVKYIQNLSGMSMRSVTVLPSELNDEGRDDCSYVRL